MAKRYEALGWHGIHVINGNMDVDGLRAVIAQVRTLDLSTVDHGGPLPGVALTNMQVAYIDMGRYAMLFGITNAIQLSVYVQLPGPYCLGPFLRLSFIL